MFETDGRLVNFHAEQSRDRIHLMARRNSADDRAGPAAIFFQMIERERQHLVRRQPGAIFVHNTESVRVAIQPEPELRFAAAHELADLSHTLGVWLRMMPAEKGIYFVVKRSDLRARAFEQLVQVTAPRAIHQLHG